MINALIAPQVYTTHIRNVIKRRRSGQKISDLAAKQRPSSTDTAERCDTMACVEPVVEDLYINETAAHPDIMKKFRRQNTIQSLVNLREAHEKIAHENSYELKKLSQERAMVTRDLRKLLIDKSVVKRTDVNLDRRKSYEFEDLNFPTSSEESSTMSEFSNLTAFVSFGRAKAPIVRGDVIQRAMSDKRLNSLKDLKMYQHWEGDPESINSVRRERKPKSVQQEQLIFARGRRFDLRNGPTTSPHTTRVQPISAQSKSPLIRRAMEAKQAQGKTTPAASQSPAKSVKKKPARKISSGSKNKIQPL